MKYNSNNLQNTYIIAEMSANHGGSLARAKEIIHAAKESGADCIKLQTYTADTLTIDCDSPYFHIDTGTWAGENLYSLYSKAYTPWVWQADLKAEADKIGLDFFSTPFDKTAVDFLEDIGVEFYKIASFELVDIPLIQYTASKGKPLIISTGMGSVDEIQEALDTVYACGNHDVAILKCSSAYPAISDEMNLATIPDMIQRFHIPVGLSDHSMGSLAACTAVAMGARIIEKHFCISRKIENPDASFSMEPKEFADMVQNVRLVEKAKGQVYYGASSQERDNLAFRRSVFAVKDIARGELITEENVRVIRPGAGLLPKYYDKILGTRAAVSIGYGTPLSFDMLEGI